LKKYVSEKKEAIENHLLVLGSPGDQTKGLLADQAEREKIKQWSVKSLEFTEASIYGVEDYIYFSLVGRSSKRKRSG
jgi:hypothetical protein